MKHQLMELPYDPAALAPAISAETISYHYGKHHAGYVQQTQCFDRRDRVCGSIIGIHYHACR